MKYSSFLKLTLLLSSTAHAAEPLPKSSSPLKGLMHYQLCSNGSAYISGSPLDLLEFAPQLNIPYMSFFVNDQETTFEIQELKFPSTSEEWAEYKQIMKTYESSRDELIKKFKELSSYKELKRQKGGKNLTKIIDTSKLLDAIKKALHLRQDLILADEQEFYIMSDYFLGSENLEKIWQEWGIQRFHEIHDNDTIHWKAGENSEEVTLKNIFSAKHGKISMNLSETTKAELFFWNIWYSIFSQHFFSYFSDIKINKEDINRILYAEFSKNLIKHSGSITAEALIKNITTSPVTSTAILKASRINIHEHFESLGLPKELLNTSFVGSSIDIKNESSEENEISLNNIIAHITAYRQEAFNAVSFYNCLINLKNKNFIIQDDNNPILALFKYFINLSEMPTPLITSSDKIKAKLLLDKCNEDEFLNIFRFALAKKTHPEQVISIAAALLRTNTMQSYAEQTKSEIIEELCHLSATYKMKPDALIEIYKTSSENRELPLAFFQHCFNVLEHYTEKTVTCDLVTETYMDEVTKKKYLMWEILKRLKLIANEAVEKDMEAIKVCQNPEIYEELFNLNYFSMKESYNVRLLEKRLPVIFRIWDELHKPEGHKFDGLPKQLNNAASHPPSRNKCKNANTQKLPSTNATPSATAPDLEDVEVEKKKLQEQLKSSREMQIAQKEVIRELTAKLKNTEEKNSSVHKELATSQKESAHQKDVLTRIQAKNTRLEKEANELETNKNRKERIIQEKTKLLEAKSKEISALLVKNEELQSQVLAQEVEKKKSYQALSDLQKNFAQQQIEMEALFAEKMRLMQEQFEQQQAALKAGMEAKLESAREALEKEASARAQAEGQRDSMGVELRNQQKKTTALQNALAGDTYTNTLAQLSGGSIPLNLMGNSEALTAYILAQLHTK